GVPRLLGRAGAQDRGDGRGAPAGARRHPPGAARQAARATEAPAGDTAHGGGRHAARTDPWPIRVLVGRAQPAPPGPPPRIGKRGRRIGAAVLLLAGALGVGVSQVAAPDARASPAAGPWEASANAAVLGVAPSTGGISLTTYLGQAGAAYVQTESQATSAFVN